jgi:pyruvate ferredoxin oxidoreductase gamma subunit
MFQIRIHGRGGQGVVTAAELLSIAAFLDGKSAQAFPSFGAERTGAPLTAFCRIDDKPIRLREPVMSPDALIIQDATLLHQTGILDGLSEGGFLLINSGKDATALGLADVAARLPEGHCVTVPASEIAMEFVGKDMPNAVLLGAFAAMTGQVRLRSVLAAIRKRFAGTSGQDNAKAAAAAFQTLHATVEGANAFAD